MTAASGTPERWVADILDPLTDDRIVATALTEFVKAVANRAFTAEDIITMARRLDDALDVYEANREADA